jgi:hypothetical protein
MSEPEKKSRMDRLFERIESHGFESLTPSERSAFALRWLYVEVNTGGFEQFFYNDAGKLAGDALRGLEFLGAQCMADILRRAMSIFPGEVVPAGQNERQEIICNSLTDDQKELLENLDAEFYDCSEPVSDLLNAYIEKHPDEFPT